MSIELSAFAYVFAGVWVARCPRPWCVNAECYGPGPVTGRVGGLSLAEFRCHECCLVCPAVWPDNAEDIEWLLGQRPFKITRNWELWETVEDLLAENAAHGIIPDALKAGEGIKIIGGHIQDRSIVLTGAVRPMLGGA